MVPTMNGFVNRLLKKLDCATYLSNAPCIEQISVVRHTSIHTFKHEYFLGQVASLDQILYVSSAITEVGERLH